MIFLQIQKHDYGIKKERQNFAPLWCKKMSFLKFQFVHNVYLLLSFVIDFHRFDD